MWRGGRIWWVIGVLMAFLVASCDLSADSPSTPANPTSPSAPASPTSSSTTTTRGECEVEAGEPFREGDSVVLETLGEVDGATVHAALYPHPDYEGNPWSQWGQGIVAQNGRFFSAIGDHLGKDGNSYIYQYDPGSRRLTMVGDILSYVDHVPGTWGYGKIHSQMVAGPCGEVFFSTYWGTFQDIEFDGNYRGDLLFRLDPIGRSMAPLEVPVEFHGQASLAGHEAAGLIYGEAVDPVGKDDGIDRGPFFVYDLGRGETVFTGPDEPHVGYRAILVDDEGSAYYSIGDGDLQIYDPGSGESSEHDSRLPGAWLRAATSPGPDGSVYGVTRGPDHFFAMAADGDLTDLGPALGYTASVALSPDGGTMFYLPGAHGDSSSWGSPMIAVDTGTGEQTIVTELNELVETRTGYTVGGSYNIAVSPDGDVIYLGVNVGEVGSDSTFGEVMLLVIDLP